MYKLFILTEEAEEYLQITDEEWSKIILAYPNSNAPDDRAINREHIVGSQYGQDKSLSSDIQHPFTTEQYIRRVFLGVPITIISLLGISLLYLYVLISTEVNLYVKFILPFTFVICISVLIIIFLKILKIRNIRMVKFLCVIFGIIAFYSVWAIRIWPIYTLEFFYRNDVGFDLLLLIFDPLDVWYRLCLVTTKGYYTIYGVTPKGFLAWGIWGFEGIVYVGGCLIITLDIIQGRKLKRLYYKALYYVLILIQKIFNLIIRFLDWFPNAFVRTIRRIQNLFSRILDWISNVFTFIIGWIRYIFENIVNWVQDVFESIIVILNQLCQLYAYNFNFGKSNFVV